MAKKSIGIAFLILAFIWMGIIFKYSSQDGNKSTSSSDKVVDVVIDDVIKDDYYDKTPVQQAKIKDNLRYAVRKSAHFSEYSILEFLLFIGLILLIGNVDIIGVVSIVIVALYAISDELHQSFVGGRGPQIRDVVIDTFGAVMMMLFLMAILRVFQGKSKKNS